MVKLSNPTGFGWEIHKYNDLNEEYKYTLKVPGEHPIYYAYALFTNSALVAVKLNKLLDCNVFKGIRHVT